MSRDQSQRDWDRELAEIDKLMAASGAAAGPAAGQMRATGAAAPRGSVAAGAATGSRATLFTWARLVLAVTLGAAMTQWPYTHGCGFQLYLYLGAVLVLVVASLWSLVSSWRNRSGIAHFLSIALLFWGVTLAAREILPRVGYARVVASWQCS